MSLETPAGLEVCLSGEARRLGETRGLRAAWLGTSLTRSHAVAQVVLEGDESEAG